MISPIISGLKRILRLVLVRPEGKLGIAIMGHRGYVGGMWEEIGQLQFDFLVSKGLRPDSFLLDIACGSLRLGVRAIPYLDCGHYLGIEQEPALVKAGLEKELSINLSKEKQPNIVISSSFEFEKIGQIADFAIAQSLFTHLPADIIERCFEKLYPWLKDNGVFYATFYEPEDKNKNPEKPHAHRRFTYTKAEICNFGKIHGFKSNYIGNWNHPRKQVMVEYRKS